MIGSGLTESLPPPGVFLYAVWRTHFFWLKGRWRESQLFLGDERCDLHLYEQGHGVVANLTINPPTLANHG